MRGLPTVVAPRGRRAVRRIIPPLPASPRVSRQRRGIAADAAEMDLLRRAQQQAGQGRGQIVAVVGEPGVGKSRLYYEFTRSHHTEGWSVLEAGSVSYGKATSYLPVIELLKGYFKIHDRDTHREIREKVAGKVLMLDRALAEECGMRPLLAHCDAGLAKLHRRTGDHDEAHQHRERASTLYREMAMTYWLERAEKEFDAAV
ncbi:MAG: AAA family ATPase [Candidatus Rokubacteria bacterium]|nr:AAA family ATPase [Candidatus Rokubacteria bacterium]